MKKIVVVEDDRMLQEELAHVLEKEGYSVTVIEDFDQDITRQIQILAPDLVLLDLNLPNQSGFEICRSIKANGIAPVLILTSRDRLGDELHAFDLGADDYLTKPFHKEKLLARVRNLLRRFEGNLHLLAAGSFQIDQQTYTLYTSSNSAVLPPNEGRILVTLVNRYPHLVSKEELSEVLWGTDAYIDENALQVNMTRLRKTLRQLGLGEVMETVRGKGYRLREGQG